MSPETKTALAWSVESLEFGRSGSWTGRVEAETEDGWRVQLVYSEQDGLPVLRELRIRPLPRRRVPSGGLTVRRIRSLPLGGALPLLQKTAWQLARRRDREWLQTLLYGEPHKRSGRLPTPEPLLARIALRYSELLEAGTRRPVAELADALRYSRGRTRDLIGRARRRGYLTPTRRGMAGGTATDRAREVAQPTKG